MDFKYMENYKDLSKLPLFVIAAVDEGYLLVYPWGPTGPWELVHIPEGHMLVSTHKGWGAACRACWWVCLGGLGSNVCV